MAQAILEGATQPGVQVKLIHLRRSNLTRLAAEVLDAAAVAFGSPTLNHNMMPAAAAALCYLEGLKPRGKCCFAFGSYGWGKGGVENVELQLRNIGWEILREPIRAKYRPTPEILRPVPPGRQAPGRKGPGRDRREIRPHANPASGFAIYYGRIIALV